MTPTLPALAVLAALIFTEALSALARWLNVRSLSLELPAPLRGIWSEEAYARSQRYLAASTRLGLAREGFSLACLLAFLSCGGVCWLDGAARAAFPGEVGAGLAFLGALALAQALLDLPFAAWSAFVVEARFGFNTTTARTFVLDRLKGLGLAVILGGALLAAVLWAFQTLGGMAWLAAWAVVTAFSGVLLVVAPTWILPLFNRFEPLPQGDTRQALEDYARDEGFALDGVFVMDGSKRSTKANAFFTGVGKRKRISLYDTLLDKMTPEQLVAVLAHEIGHSRLGHIRTGFWLGTLRTGLTLGLAQLFLGWGGLQEAFGATRPSIHVGLMLFALAWQPLALGLGALSNAVSRRFERQADAFAARAPGGPQALAEALKALSLANLSNLTPHPLLVALEYSHPPVLERLRLLAAHGPGPRPSGAA
ncbi:Protease HtpX [Fundidesulfovibrio magnetotacticus]|uniref:Protease HtpX n=1 Tax=Fundidesulfovibrio magnetotacticus TaxID=2730080 RepID=A0A6V8M2E1_9BACT|nr:M48 family metallopeptidase [Fundidesulfovibrio magnetotacticus]GFK94615.1 Protease HtpX [Fundidesulfovibrio magnetotacticus]